MRRLRFCSLLAIALVAACSAAPNGPTEDQDGDTIRDVDEGIENNVDTDGDGDPDYLDTDSDDDDVADSVEAGDADLATGPPDSDLDGTPDFRDEDSDDNGRADGVDGIEDIDKDGVLNFADQDDDGDTIKDTAELGSPDKPLDSDGDGVADFQDTDSDNDFLADKDEVLRDPDGDLLPAYLDDDSDGDCVPDKGEVLDDDLETPPEDIDEDGYPNFLDFDSDGDGLADEKEDPNCNGILDMGETSPLKGDSDGDGANDLVEIAVGTNPNNATDSPEANGDFWFIVPYKGSPTPPNDTLDFSTDVSRADVVFAMDTTGSMGGAISQLNISLSQIVDTLSITIPDIAIGVSGYDDYPTSPFGSAGDSPFYLKHRVMTTATPQGKASVQAAVSSLTTHSGGDTPESGWEALHQIVTGAGLSFGGAIVPPFDPLTAPPVPIPAGESVGEIGGVGFRGGALPVVVMITDAASHNSPGTPGDNYPWVGAATRGLAVNELYQMGGRLLGVITTSGDFTAARGDMIPAVMASGAFVTPEAWGPAGMRPPSCPVTSCCTGFQGAGEPPDMDGSCPLVFTVNESGMGLGNAIVDAIVALTKYVALEISIKTEDVPGDEVDAVASFVDGVYANPSAPSPCAQGLVTVDVDMDGKADGFKYVLPGQTACFDVVPKPNVTVPPAETVKVYKAQLTIFGNQVAQLDTRTVFFLVPPELPEEPPL